MPSSRGLSAGSRNRSYRSLDPADKPRDDGAFILVDNNMAATRPYKTLRREQLFIDF